MSGHGRWQTKSVTVRIVTVLAVCAASFAALAPVPEAASQGGTTTVGTDFWVAFPPNYSNGATYDLDISADQATSGTVTPEGAGAIPFTVSVGTVTTVAVTDVVPQGDNDNIVDEGIHITAEAPVTVYGLNLFSGTSDAYTALPTVALGTRYRVASYTPNLGPSFPSRLTVVATSPGTTVTVTPSVAAGTHSADTPFTEALDQGQVYTLTSTSDLTGTLVTSDNPVAVYGSVDCVDINSGAGGACDVIMQQVPPTTAWGTDFVAVRFAKDQNGDPFRVIADTDGTVVTVNGVQVATLGAGQYFTATYGAPVGSNLNVGTHISTSQPALVIQYQTAGTYTEGGTSTTGDPSMMLVPPDQQFLSSYTIGVPGQFVVNAANVAIPTSATSTLVLDGTSVPASDFNPIAGTTFSSTQLALQPGSHTLPASLPFGVWVYGENSANSYAYPGGYSASSVATITSLVLGGSPPYTAVTGSQFCLPVTVEDNNGNPLPGILVNASITGANPTTTFAVTNDSGVAEICYVGTSAGTDQVDLSAGTVTASATVAYSAEQTSTTLTATSTTLTSTAFTSPSVPVTTATGPTTTQAAEPVFTPPSTASVPTAGAVAATPGGTGYWALISTGQLNNYGTAANYGSENGTEQARSIVALASTSNGQGYWLASSKGSVFAFGNAHFYGSMSNRRLNRTVVGIVSTPDGHGYWLVGADGGVFNFGDAHFYGSTGNRHLNRAVVGIAVTPDGDGYWLVGADGSVFTFGDARSYGSMARTRLNKRVVGIAGTPSGSGYWLVAADGGVFTFGDAHFYGSIGKTGNVKVVGLVSNGNLGYRLVTAGGGTVGFGHVP